MALATAPYTICTIKGAANETIDGYPQKYFESPTDSNTWAYGFENDYTINATDIVLATNTSQDMRVGIIKIPFDAVYVADKTRFSITVELTGNTAGAQLQCGFSRFRNSESLRIKKNFNGSQTCTLEFDTIAMSAILLRAQHVGNGNNADDFGRESRIYNVNLMGNFQLPIHIKFANADSSQSVVRVTASAVVGAAQFNVDANFFRGKDTASDVPFEADDFFNQTLTANAVARPYETCYDRADPNGTHISTTAGSDIITVGDSSNVRVGDYASIGFTFIGASASPYVWRGDANYRVATYENTLSKTVLGYQTFVTEIISATQVRLNKNALLDYTNDPVNVDNRVMTLVTMPAPTASMYIADTTDSFNPSPLCWDNKADDEGNAYQGQIAVIPVVLTDPVKTWNFNYVVVPNGFLFPIPDDQANTFGETFDDGTFDMHTPTAYVPRGGNRNSDRNAQFLLPGGRYAVEVYLQQPPDGNDEILTSRLCAADLFGESVPNLAWDTAIQASGASKATRAFGGNFTGGMVTSAEAADITANCYTGLLEADIDADMAYAKTAIPHKIAITLSACQHMSPDYKVNGTGSVVTFFSHKSYMNQAPIVNGGSGYALEDVIYLNGTDIVSPTLYTVTAVDGSGTVLSAFVTHCGQYMTNPASATHATTSSGAGTGAVFNTVGLIGSGLDVMKRGVFPSVSVDNSSINTYNGSIPMGAMFTIDPNFDLDGEFKSLIERDIAANGSVTERSSYHWYALLSAMKAYGAVTVDVAINTSLLCQLDDTMTTTEIEQFSGDVGSFTFPNMATTSRLLTFVENSTPFDYTNPPTISVVGGAGRVNQFGTYTDQGVYAYDEIEYDVSDQVVQSGLDVNTIGIDTVNFDFTNLNGLSATTQSRSVSVVPTPSNIVSFQTGAIQLGSGDTTDSVTLPSAVNQSNSILITNMDGGSNTNGTYNVAIALSSDGTTVTATRNTSGSVVNIRYTVIESASFNVQHFEVTNPGTTTFSQALTPINTAYAFPILNGLRAGGSTRENIDSAGLNITSTTNIDVVTGTTAGVVYTFQVVEMTSQEIASVQKISYAQTTAEVDTTITSVDPAKSLMFGSASYTSATLLPNSHFPTYELTSATNLRTEAGGINNDLTHYIYVIEFVNLAVDTTVVTGIAGTTTTEVLAEVPGKGQAIINGFAGTFSYADDADDDSLEGMWSASLSGDTWTFTRGAATTTAELSYSVFDWDSLFAVSRSDALLKNVLSPVLSNVTKQVF